MNYHLFYSGPFSQWHHSPFKYHGLDFSCCEQFMMVSKALLFNDQVSAEAILKEKQPSSQKSLGRSIKNFNEKIWDENKLNVVFLGNYLKFTSSDELKEILLKTGNTLLVEASPFDKIWGIGLGMTDPRKEDESLWRGQNLLGICITGVREKIKKEIDPLHTISEELHSRISKIKHLLF
jgi:ribA/ribD-fused uncharacterized protein